MIHKTLFSAVITDGFSLKNMIGMLKNETEEITFVVSKTHINITFLNKGQYAIHDLSITTEELSEYSYDILGHDEYPITVNTNELCNTTKAIGRKDSIKIYWLENFEKLCIQPIKSSKEPGRSSASFINIINKTHTPIMLNNEYSMNEPSIKIQNRDFTDICQQANVLKCNFLEIAGNSSHVIFKGILPDETYGMMSRHTSQNNKKSTNIDEHKIANGQLELNIVNKSEDVMKVKVPIMTVKTLAKLHTISPSGTLLKFSFANDKPVKIESKIGSYGIYKIYLRDYKTN